VSGWLGRNAQHGSWPPFRMLMSAATLHEDLPTHSLATAAFATAGSPAHLPECVRKTGCRGDNGMDHDKNPLRFPYASVLLRTHYLPPHP
jgi:hypothetical protein